MPYDMQISCMPSSAKPSASRARCRAGHTLLVTNTQHQVQVGERLRMAIEAKGITQAAVCRALGVGTSKLGNWLRGDNYPDPYFIKQFCDRYGVSADWIYRGVVSGMPEDVADALWKREGAASAE